MSAADRKAEIERKKATLIAIRENRKKREESRRSGLEDGSAAELGKVASNGDLGQTTEEILKTLGIPVGEEPVGTQNATDAQDSALAAAKTPTTTRKRKHLQFSRIIESSVPPPQSIQYSKEVQTIAQLSERENRPKDYYVLTYEETSREEEDVDASAALAELQKMPHVGLSQTSQKGRTRLENGVTQEEVKKPVNLSEEDKTRILSSDDFIQFFNRSAQIIERAICEPEDALFLDYTGGEREAETSRELVTVCHEFFDERWSKRRVVTSLEWSTIYPELLLAAYHINEEAAHEPEGVCLIWNMKFPKKTSPEFIFHCQSPITSATLSKFHPNLVIGGTYSGQIVLWDSRVNKRTPVQRSPLTSMAHTHPVFAVTVVGTQNAHNIISLGSDGSLCAWNIEMLAQPREKSRVCEVPSATGGGHFELYPTCMSFFANDVNNYAVGAENGNAYCGQRHSSRTATTDDASRNVPYKGHCAPITAISTHPCPGAMNFSSLFLTSSLDWTVRLWSTSEYTPLHTFEDYFDYVYDVSWSPVHPAVFAAVDGTGRLDVWNINQDVEVPCARHSIRGHAGQDRTGGNIALNKCRWDSSGSYLAAGDNQGRVTICSVHESLSQPGPEQWSELARSLTDLKHYKMEQEVGRAEM